VGVVSQTIKVRGNRNGGKEDFLAKKIKVLHANLRFEDLGIIRFQENLKIGYFM